MDDDEIGALRDFVSAAFHYFTAPTSEAAARRADLCEAVGQLLFALEGPLPPDDDPDDDDGPGSTISAPAQEGPTQCVRIERFVDIGDTGGTVVPERRVATVIPLHGLTPRRRTRRPKWTDQ